MYTSIIWVCYWHGSTMTMDVERLRLKFAFLAQNNAPTNPTIETRLTRDSMDLKTFRGPSRGETDDNGVVLTRFASLNNNAPAEGVRRLSLGEGKGSLDKSSSLRRQLLAPPVKPRDTKSLNM